MPGARRATRRAARHADHRLAGDDGGAAPDAAADALCHRQSRGGSGAAHRHHVRTGQDVLEQRVDGAFVCGPVAHPDLEEQVMFREELVVLAAPCRVARSVLTPARRGWSCCAPAVPIVRCWKRCWRGAASWCSACWSSARWRRSSAASRRPRHHPAAARTGGGRVRGGACQRSAAARGRNGGNGLHPPPPTLRLERATGVPDVHAYVDRTAHALKAVKARTPH